jgi:hypothetical protein
MMVFWAILRRDAKELLWACRWVPPALYAVCVLFAFSLPVGLGDTLTPFALAVSPGGNAILSSVLTAALDEVPLLSEVHVCEGEAEARQLLDSGSAQVAILLPEGIEAALVSGDHIRIQVISHRALEGTLVNALTQSAAEAVNALQSAGNFYYTAAAGTYEDPNAFYTGYLTFYRTLLLDALARSELMEVHQPANPYLTQLTAIWLFVIVSAGGICVAAVTAEQREAARRMRAQGSGVLRLGLAKLLETALCGCLLTVPVAAAARLLGVAFSPWRLLVSVCILSLLAGPCYLLCAWLCKSAVRTLAAGTTVMLTMLFAGGCLYPPYRMGFLLPNPATPAFLLAGWLLC